MGNFAENLNLGNRFRPPPPVYAKQVSERPQPLPVYYKSITQGWWIQFDQIWEPSKG